MKPSTRKWRKQRDSKSNPRTHVTMSQCCDWLFTCHVTFSKTRTLWLAFVRSGHPGGPKVPPGGLWLNQVPPAGLNSINLITETIFDEHFCLKRKIVDSVSALTESDTRSRANVLFGGREDPPADRQRSAHQLGSTVRSEQFGTHQWAKRITF